MAEVPIKNYIYRDSEKKYISYRPSVVKQIYCNQFRILYWIEYTELHYLVIQGWNPNFISYMIPIWIVGQTVQSIFFLHLIDCNEILSILYELPNS